MLATLLTMMFSVAQFPTHLGRQDREVIRVRDQVAFDSLQHSLQQAVAEGRRKVVVKLSRGTYFYDENHLDLRQMDAPELEIIVEGHDSRLIAKGNSFSLSEGVAPYAGRFSPLSAYVDMQTLQPLDMQSEVRQALSVPSVISAEDTLYRMRVREADIPPEWAQNMYLILSQWYASGVYPLAKIEDGYLYFTSQRPQNELVRDYYYAKRNPRYILINQASAERPCIVGDYLYYKGSELHECHATRFLNLEQVRMARLHIQGLHFIGNQGSESLLRLRNVRAVSLEVDHCSFRGIHGRILDCLAADQLYFHDNELSYCYLNGVTVDGASHGARIENNDFHDNGWRMTQSFDLVMQGQDFVVRGNRFVDFNYAAIGVGYHFRSDGGEVTSGIIERNEICQTPALLEGRQRTLMDSGAIYIWTMNRDVTIRNNYIHDIGGVRDNRAIFGDDGASHITVYGNLILDTRNSYDIDFRRVSSVETLPDSRIDRVNVGNRIYGNTLSGKVRLEGRGGDDGCYFGEQIRVRENEDRAEILRRWRKGKTDDETSFPSAEAED